MSSSSSSSKTKLYPLFDSLQAEPNPQWWHRGLGFAVVGIFVVTWISSLLSPLLLAWSLQTGHHALTIGIVTISIISYLPWKRGALCHAWQGAVCFAHYRLYQSTRLFVEGDDNNDDQSTAAAILQNYPDPTFFAVHTHGAFCLGWSCIFHNPLWAKRPIQFCFAPALYASPFFRLFARCTGYPGSASKASMQACMKQGAMDVALPPGGFEEATIHSQQQDRVFIQKRTGFIKLCLQHGYHVRPVYTFGEKQTFWNAQGFWKLRLALNGLGFPAILVWGQPLCPILPKRNLDMVVVVGKPLVLPHISNPSREVVQEWHAKYVQALQALFEKHKEMAYGRDKGGKDCKIEVW